MFRYCGEYFDKETGTVYLRARYYNPSVGRFISEDTNKGKIENPLSLNLYTYCWSNPLGYTDPTGNDPEDTGIKNFESQFLVNSANFLFVDDVNTAFDANASLEAKALAIYGLTSGGKAVKSARTGTKIVEKSLKWAGEAASKGWKVGDDIYKPTAKGNEPAWNTIKSRFWKNEAAKPGAVDQYGADNVERMRKGNATQRYNPDKGGMESMELSHEPIPQRDGGTNFVPMWPQDHAGVDPYRRPGY